MVITTDSNEKQDYLHIVEDVYPLFPFRTLTTNIDHLVGQVAQLEDGLGYASGPQTRSQNVLVCGKEISGKQALNVLEEAALLSAGKQR